MRRHAGILILFLVIVTATALASDRFFYGPNLENVLRRTSLFGIISLGAAFVIVTAGIDLSIGSVVCLAGVLLPYLSVRAGLPIAVSAVAILFVCILLGAFHGYLVGRLRVPAFVVTLCGLLLYRGAARGITADQTQGFGTGFEQFRRLATGRITVPGFEHFAVPAPALILAALAAAAAFFLHATVWGRYLKAIGSNEQAARYAGVPTLAMTILAYSLCALFSGIGGMLFVLDVNSAQPADFGNFYELYAIAGAVLGGCSLSGGEAPVAGVILGAAVMQVLRNALTLLDVPTQLEYAMIGAVLLIGVAGGRGAAMLLEETMRKLRRSAAAGSAS
jgi:ribose transport system permease protein